MRDKREQGGLRIDRPLKAGSALDADALGRRSFAARVTEVLGRVTPESGLVVSIEGAWGCGKTSLLAMVEDLLRSGKVDQPPVIVHFNPWLVGDRDALLRQFLASIAKAVKLTDHAKEGKRVAKELKTYAKAFDILKFLPGAEPWASIIKSVVESVGDASDAVFDYKTPDIEARKQDLEQALRRFPRRIVVLVDDLDRLYPAEVYEMVRIIKAVGDLPNVGYILAWDEKFVSAALECLGVPFAAAYLDKVVQVRLSVPSLSFVQRVCQMNEGLARLSPDAREHHFPGGDDRHSLVFHHGLSELMEHPRDVVRLFDLVLSIEPNLRGEVHLADLIGLAALMTKAPAVFSLLRRTPQAFVGRRPGARSILDKPEDIIKVHTGERDEAIAECTNSRAVRDLVHCLFPKTAKADDEFALDRVVFTEGHLAHPDRLSVALQLSTGNNDVSLVNVRRFLFHPLEREAIGSDLGEESCAPFLDCLGSMVESLGNDVQLDAEQLIIDLARLVEKPSFVNRAKSRNEILLMSLDRLALAAIGAVAQRLEPSVAGKMAEQLIGDAQALTVAVTIALSSYVEERVQAGPAGKLKASPNGKSRTLARLSTNLIAAANSGELFNKVNSGRILWFAPLLIPTRCKALFRAVKQKDPSLDSFVLCLLGGGVDSVKGQHFCFPPDTGRLEKYTSMHALKQHAAVRLKDSQLRLPALAAWRAVATGESLYAVDGSTVER